MHTFIPPQPAARRDHLEYHSHFGALDPPQAVSWISANSYLNQSPRFRSWEGVILHKFIFTFADQGMSRAHSCALYPTLCLSWTLCFFQLEPTGQSRLGVTCGQGSRERALVTVPMWNIQWFFMWHGDELSCLFALPVNNQHAIHTVRWVHVSRWPYF
jgi:hypothetical protein